MPYSNVLLKRFKVQEILITAYLLIINTTVLNPTKRTTLIPTQLAIEHSFHPILEFILKPLVEHPKMVKCVKYCRF